MFSKGNTISNAPASGFGPGTLDVRRQAAARELSRRDTKMSRSKVGDNNKRSNPKGQAGAPAKGSKASQPPATPTGSMKAAEQLAPQAVKVAETQHGDAFAEASQKALERLRGK